MMRLAVLSLLALQAVVSDAKEQRIVYEGNSTGWEVTFPQDLVPFTDKLRCRYWVPGLFDAKSVIAPVECERAFMDTVTVTEAVADGCVTLAGSFLAISEERFAKWFPEVAEPAERCGSNITYFIRDAHRCMEENGKGICDAPFDSTLMLEWFVGGELSCDAMSWMSSYYEDEWTDFDLEEECPTNVMKHCLGC